MREQYDWPLAPDASPQQIHRLYKSGFPGCFINPQTAQDVLDDPAVPNVLRFGDACPHLRGLHKSVERAALWLPQLKHDRDVYEGEPQPRGNCVARGSQNARCTTNSVEILNKGEAEKYERQAWESTYLFRGHRGEGMDPALAAKVDSQIGFLWRRQYPFGDLSAQNSRFCDGVITQAIRDEMGRHKVGRWVFPETGEEALDLLAAGYAIHSGQMAGFSPNCNSRGYHPLNQRWNHDMATVGYDRTRQYCPEEFAAVPNSWGDWNSPPSWWPRQLWGPPIKGLIICRLSDWIDWFVGSRSIFAYCDIEGIPAKTVDWRIDEWL